MQSENQQGAVVRLPPPLLPIATIIVGYGLGRLLPLSPGYALPAPGRYWLGGLVCIAAVIIFLLLPFRQFQATGQDPKPWTPTPELVVAGLYRYTRNPMYLGMLVFCVGFAIILSEPWVLILTPVCGWLIYLLAIRAEEIYLENKFGDSYRAYKATVRRWI